jgi:hypothetical protein
MPKYSRKKSLDYDDIIGEPSGPALFILDS